MTKYEMIFESLQDKVDFEELTLEEAEILNDMAYEKYAEEEYEEEEVDPVIEAASDLILDGTMTVEEAMEAFEITEKTGNNEVLKQTLKKVRVAIKEDLKDINKAVKNKEYDKAEDSIEKCKKSIKTIKEVVIDTETDTEDDVLSLVPGILITAATGLGSIVTVVGNNMAIDKAETEEKYQEYIQENLIPEVDKISLKEYLKNSIAIVAITKAILGSIEAIKAILTSINGDEGNTYKSKIMSSIDKFSTELDKLSDVVRRKKKAEEKIEKIKESLKKNKKKIAIGAGATAAAVGAGTVVYKKISKAKTGSKIVDDMEKAKKK